MKVGFWPTVAGRAAVVGGPDADVRLTLALTFIRPSFP